MPLFHILNIAASKQIEVSNYSLAPWLQITVAIATGVSSCAVFIYLWQTVLLNKQLALLKAQQCKDEKQFEILNQSYLSIEANATMGTTMAPVGTDMQPGMLYNRVEFTCKVTNVGNTPLLFLVDTIKIYFGDDLQFEDKSLEGEQSALYPHESSSMGLGSVMFDRKHNRLFSVQEIQRLKVNCRLIIKYQDFGSQREKKVDRKLIFLIDDLQSLIQYTNIQDTI